MSSHLARATVVTLCLATFLAGCSGGDRETSVATSSARERRDPSTPAEPLQLSGTSWRLISMDDGRDEEDTSGAEVPAVVTFDGERVDVYDGVNDASGSYRVERGRLAIELRSRSDVAPAGELPQYELIDRLPSATSVHVDGEVLTIELEDGGRLRFQLAVGVAPD